MRSSLGARTVCRATGFAPSWRSFLLKDIKAALGVSGKGNTFIELLTALAVGALEWSDALDKLVEYAELDADGKPAGRMPLLLRVADHFGIDHGVAKDVCKTLVLRVLNGGQVAAWCRDMDIVMPEGEPQRDLDDLEEVARIVRQAFFEMMKRDNPGSLEVLRTRTWRTCRTSMCGRCRMHGARARRRLKSHTLPSATAPYSHTASSTWRTPSSTASTPSCASSAGALTL